MDATKTKFWVVSCRPCSCLLSQKENKLTQMHDLCVRICKNSTSSPAILSISNTKGEAMFCNGILLSYTEIVSVTASLMCADSSVPARNLILCHASLVLWFKILWPNLQIQLPMIS